MENENRLSVIYAIHMKMNWQLSKPIIFFFRLNFNVYTDADNKERAIAKTKNKGDEFRGKNDIFCSGGEKMKNASGHRGENERQ